MVVRGGRDEAGCAAVLGGCEFLLITATVLPKRQANWNNLDRFTSSGERPRRKCNHRDKCSTADKITRCGGITSGFGDFPGG